MYFAGNLSSTRDNISIFAGIALALTFVNVTFISIADGVSTAVETLSSQHYGAQNYKEVGDILYRSIFVLGIIAVPILSMWWFASSYFMYIGVEESTCAVLHTFITIRMLAIPADIVWLSYEKYLIAINIRSPSLYAAIAHNISILAVQYLLVHIADLGVEGLAWSLVICNTVKACTMIAVSSSFSAVQLTLHPPTVAALHDLQEFASFGLPGCVMICAEWWAFEIITIMASLISSAAVSALSIAQQIMGIAFMIPMGIGIVASTVVGNALGAGDLALATDLGFLSVQYMAVLSLLICPLILLLGPAFMHLYSADPEVISICNALTVLVALSTLFDGLQGVASGVVRGAGKQRAGAFLNIVAFYVFGIPVAWFLCFKYSMGVRGLMIGVIVGSATQAVVLIYVVLYRTMDLYTEIDSVSRRSDVLYSPTGSVRSGM
eukprot:CAMPEP_0185022006 /NCGR_PEP_ID=MMETSP1103-20130426/4719_1 /TAXON_ID=36769 /ORGANISM="Paraphysomonas bandaiensis, Strain Caron Lab Isolate" /LENGTH=435 /DNA_ID=CAMNT_0027553859 /DNA_START=221 /DNA_END=1528 /DNA_ORIENTATION=+